MNWRRIEVNIAQTSAISTLLWAFWVLCGNEKADKEHWLINQTSIVQQVEGRRRGTPDWNDILVRRYWLMLYRNEGIIRELICWRGVLCVRKVLCYCTPTNRLISKIPILLWKITQNSIVWRSKSHRRRLIVLLHSLFPLTLIKQVSY